MHLPLLMWKTLSGFGTKSAGEKNSRWNSFLLLFITKSDGIDFFYRF